MLILRYAIHSNASSRSLRPIHRHVRAAQQGVGILTVVRCDGNANTGVHVDRLALQHERCLKRRSDPFGDTDRSASVGAG